MESPGQFQLQNVLRLCVLFQVEMVLLGVGAVQHRAIFPSHSDSRVGTALSEHAGIFGDHCIRL